MSTEKWNWNWETLSRMVKKVLLKQNSRSPLDDGHPFSLWCDCPRQITIHIHLPRHFVNERREKMISIVQLLLQLSNIFICLLLMPYIFSFGFSQQTIISNSCKLLYYYRSLCHRFISSYIFSLSPWTLLSVCLCMCSSSFFLTGTLISISCCQTQSCFSSLKCLCNNSKKVYLKETVKHHEKKLPTDL